MILGLLLFILGHTAHATIVGNCEPQNKFANQFVSGLQESLCADLSVGREKVVNEGRWSSPTGVPHKYILRRTGQSEYTILLNLNFKSTWFLKNPNLAMQMEKKIRDCLGGYNGAMKTPEGVSVKLDLLKGDEKSRYSEISSVVRIDPKPVHRENSSLYSLQSSCSTLLHEFLHLTGLADEYVETEDHPVISEHACRAYGPADSVMHYHNQAVVTLDKNVQVVQADVCVCPKGARCDDALIPAMKIQKRCLGNYKQDYSFYPGKADDKLSDIAESAAGMYAKLMYDASKPPMSGGSSMFIPDGKQVVLIDYRKRTSPLYPAHFRSILYPGCESKNKLYYACARWAYAYDIKFITSCPERPKECNEPLEWLR